MLQVMFSYEGNTTVRMNELTRKFEQTREGLAEIAELIAERNESKWGEGVELQPETIAWKERMGASSEPLVETDEMKEELTNPERGIKLITDKELVFGSTAKAKGSDAARAYLLQHGTKNMRPKKVMQINIGTRLAMRHIMHEKLLGP